MHLVILVAALAAVAAGQSDWEDGYWRSGDANFDAYRRRFRANNCGYDTRRQAFREDGESWEVGLYRYTCRNGERTPAACLDRETNQWVELNNQRPVISANGYYGKSCRLDSGNYMRLVTSHCVMNGREAGPGEQFDGPKRKYYFLCQQSADALSVRPTIAGCYTDSGIQVPVNQTVEIDSLQTWYRCNEKPNRAVAFCSQGCLDGGRRYRIGETWTDSWDSRRQYRCEKANGSCQKVEISASFDEPRGNGETYAGGAHWDGNTYHRDDTTFHRHPGPVTNTNSWDAMPAPRDGYCLVSELGKFKYFLPRDTFYRDYSQEWMKYGVFTCEWNGYEYASKKYNDDQFNAGEKFLTETFSPVYERN